MLNLQFTPFPVLHTERLTLRNQDLGDTSRFFELRSNPELMKFIPRPLAETMDDAAEHIQLLLENIEKNAAINWVISLKDNSEMIGVIGIYRIKPENDRGEIGYMLLKPYHMQGYATEAIHRVTQYCFDDLHFHSLEAVIDPDNTASETVLIKNGYVKEAHIRENEWWDGKYLDTVIYSLLNRDFKR